jgi:hypothetical protein
VPTLDVAGACETICGVVKLRVNLFCTVLLASKIIGSRQVADLVVDRSMSRRN